MDREHESCSDFSKPPGKRLKKQKGRSTKTKQDTRMTTSADDCQTYTLDQVIGSNSAISSGSSTENSIEGDAQENGYLTNSSNSFSPIKQNEDSNSSIAIKKGIEDNRLMPPPPSSAPNPENEVDKMKKNQDFQAAGESSSDSNSWSNINKNEIHDKKEESEVIIDGFAIAAFSSLEQVQEALSATGRAFERMELADRSSVTSSKTPRLPTRDTRSPTGRKKSRASSSNSTRTKEPRTPRHGKRTAASRSPLACSSTSSLVPSDSDSQSMSPHPSTSSMMTSKVEPADSERSLDSVPHSQLKTEKAGAKDSLPSYLSSVKQQAESTVVKSEPYVSHKLDIKDLTKLSATKPSLLSSSTYFTPITATAPPATSALDSTPLTSSDMKLYSTPVKFTPRFENISPDITKPPLAAGQLSHSSPSTIPPGCDPVTAFPWSGNASTTTSFGSFNTTATTAVATPRSNSVHSVNSSSSRHNTPVCTPSAASTASRDRENSSRAASRSSDRNTSRSSGQPATSAVDSLSPAIFGSQSYNNMLSFGGPNSLPAPFGYSATAAIGQPHANFPFGSPEMLSQFNSSTPLANASPDQIRAELSRRMLMQASERGAVPPFLRPEQMFPPHNSAMGGTSIPQTGGIPPNLPSAVFFQQMFDKTPHMLLSQRGAAANAASVATTTASAVEPSPFQSVPGGHSNPSATADSSQKRASKWCAAHVRIAYFIYNATKLNQRTEGARNGLLAAGVADSDRKQPSGPINLTHSIGAITASTIHRPRDVPANQMRPRLSPAPSPAGKSSEGKTTPSPLQRVDRQSKQKSGASSPASFTSSSSGKDLSAASNRNVANGVIPSAAGSASRLNQQSSPMSLPSTSLSTSLSYSTSLSHSPALKKHGKEDPRKSAHSLHPTTTKRPSSSTSHLSTKKRRSRSRSPPKSSHTKSAVTATQPHWSVAVNGHHAAGVDANKSNLAPSSISNSVLDFQQQQQQSQLLSMFALMSDNKSLPTNGFAANAAAQGLWNPYLQQQRERLLNQINPSLALGFPQGERSATVAGRQYLDMDRATSLHSSSLTGLNGFHTSSVLTGMGGLAGIGGPPPLIPTSQAKLPHTHPSALSASSTPNGSNLLDRTDRMFPR